MYIVGGILVFWFLMVNVPTLLPNIFNIASSCIGGFTEIDIPVTP